MNLNIAILMITLGLISMSCSHKPVLPPGLGSKQTTAASGSFLFTDAGHSGPLTDQSEIRPGFLLQMTSPMEKALNISLRVNFLGEILLPYDVRWAVVGLTVKELRAKLNAHFRPYYKADPEIQVRVSERKYFIEVRGLVAKPGPVLVQERESLDDVIRRAGPAKGEHAAAFVQVIRGENSFNIDLTEYFQGRGLDQSPRWFGGEKVLFLQSSTALAQDESKTIQLIGDVRTPGPLAFKDKADFYHYLLKSGGTTPTSDLDRVQVMRRTAEGPVLTKGSALDIAKNIQLEPGDTIILGSTLPGKEERRLQFIAVLASVISAISIFTVAF